MASLDVVFDRVRELVMITIYPQKSHVNVHEQIITVKHHECC